MCLAEDQQLKMKSNFPKLSTDTLICYCRWGSAHSFVVVDGAVCELNVAVFDVYSPALGRAPQVLALRYVPQEDVRVGLKWKALTYCAQTPKAQVSTHVSHSEPITISKWAPIEGSTHGLQTNSTHTSEHPCATKRANQQAGSNGRQHSRPAHKHQKRK